MQRGTQNPLLENWHEIPEYAVDVDDTAADGEDAADLEIPDTDADIEEVEGAVGTAGAADLVCGSAVAGAHV